MSEKHVTLRLSKSGVEALFPAGTEARLELQQSLLQNLAASYIGTTLSQENRTLIDNMIREQTYPFQQESAEYIRDRFTLGQWGSRFVAVRPDSDVAQVLNNLVETRSEAIFRKYVEEAIDQRMKALEVDMDNRINRAVDYAARTLRAENINVKATTLLRKALLEMEKESI